MVPEGWTSKKLDSVVAAKVTYGVVQPGSERKGGVPFIRGGDFPNGKINAQKLRTISSEIADAYSRTKLRGGEILVSLVGYPGATAIVPDELAGANIARQAALVRSGKAVNRDYLYYFLSSDIGQKRLLAKTLGSAQQVINLRDLKDVEIDIPPLPEQRKIAEILSTWDRAIETTEALLAAAKAQKRALMQTLLTGKRRFPEFEGRPWREVRLGRLCDINPRLTTIANDDRLTFLSMDAVSEEGRILRRDDGTTSQYGTGYTRFQDGDVLVAKITPCFENGKGCHATGLTNGLGAGSTEFHVLRAKDERDQRFVFQVVNSHPFRTRGEANMQGSAGQRRVPTDFIRAYLVHAPASADERGRIAEVLDEADRLAEEHKTQIEKLRTEKSALMQQLLTGKRRVQV